MHFVLAQASVHFYAQNIIGKKGHDMYQPTWEWPCCPIFLWFVFTMRNTWKWKSGKQSWNAGHMNDIR